MHSTFEKYFCQMNHGVVIKKECTTGEKLVNKMNTTDFLKPDFKSFSLLTIRMVMGCFGKTEEDRVIPHSFIMWVKL